MTDHDRIRCEALADHWWATHGRPHWVTMIAFAELVWETAQAASADEPEPSTHGLSEMEKLELADCS